MVDRESPGLTYLANRSSRSGIPLNMDLGSNTSKRWIIPGILLILAMIAACEISPRREVVNNPQISPTPTVSPTPIGSPTPIVSPTPIISPTPTPTPTPTPIGMSTAVPTEFLFTADPNAGVILGFRINRDGGLSAVPGSPLVARNSPRLVAAVGSNLLVADEKNLTVFAIAKGTGKMTKTDSRALPSISNLTVDPVSRMAFATMPLEQVELQVVNNKLQVSATSVMEPSSASATSMTDVRIRKPVIDASGHFAYLLDSSTGEISAFQVESGRMTPLSPATYAAGRGAISLSIVKP